MLFYNTPTEGAKAEASLGYVKNLSQQSNKQTFRPGFPLGKNGEKDLKNGGSLPYSRYQIFGVLVQKEHIFSAYPEF